MVTACASKCTCKTVLWSVVLKATVQGIETFVSNYEASCLKESGRCQYRIISSVLHLTFGCFC